MCGPWCFQIVRRSLEYWPTSPQVLEVGSYNVNGSVRGVGEPLAASYLGVDIQPGPGVDQIVNALDIVEVFGAQSFDVVISTEMLEHVEDWPQIVYNLVAVLRVDGILILTTRDVGMYYHGYPGDYWRFSPSDLRKIFEPIGAVINAEKDTDDQAWGSGIVVRREAFDLEEWRASLDHIPIHGVDMPPIKFIEFRDDHKAA